MNNDRDKSIERVVCYIRVSTQEQARDDRHSIPEQKRRLESFCHAKDWRLMKTYVDPGFSGAKMDRPALQDMLAELPKIKPDAVVVYKLDRLSRRQRDTLELIDIFDEHGAAFVSMSESFDTSTPFGRCTLGVLSAFAELERLQISERMQMGAEGRAREGLWHGGGYDPIGYDYVGKRLVVNEYEASIVRDTYRRFLAGEPITSIALDYWDKGYRHKHGLFGTDNVVRSIVSTPLYAGYITWKGERYEGQHEPLVSREDFARAEELLEQRAASNKRRTPGFAYTSLLAGMTWCACCGARYYTKQCRGGHPTPDRPYNTLPVFRYYNCYSVGKTSRRRVIDPNCKAKRWRMEKLDAIVIGEVAKLQADPSYVDTIRSADDKAARLAADRSAREKRLGQVKAEQSKLVDLFTAGIIGIDVLSEKAEALEKEREALETELAQLSAIRPSIGETELSQRLKAFSDVFDNPDTTLDERRAVLKALVDRVECTDTEEVRIRWKFI